MVAEVMRYLTIGQMGKDSVGTSESNAGRDDSTSYEEGGLDAGKIGNFESTVVSLCQSKSSSLLVVRSSVCREIRCLRTKNSSETNAPGIIGGGTAISC